MKINKPFGEKTEIDSNKKNHKVLLKNTKLILGTQERFKSESHNVFTEEINKVALSTNDDKKCSQLIR